MHLRTGIIAFLEAQLLSGAEHTVGGDAPQLALFDVHPVGKPGIMEGGGNQRALEHVVRAGDDLHRLLAAHVDLADLQAVGVGVLFQLEDAPRHHVAHRGGQIFHALHLEAAHDHLFTKLLHGNVHVHITAEPAKGNLHYPFVLSGNIPLLKLAEEPPVVFKQQPDVADLIPGGGEPVQPDAEGEAGIDFRVDAAAPQHVGVDHARA